MSERSDAAVGHPRPKRTTTVPAGDHQHTPSNTGRPRRPFATPRGHAMDPAMARSRVGKGASVARGGGGKRKSGNLVADAFERLTGAEGLSSAEAAEALAGALDDLLDQSPSDEERARAAALLDDLDDDLPEGGRAQAESTAPTRRST